MTEALPDYYQTRTVPSKVIDEGGLAADDRNGGHRHLAEIHEGGGE